MSAVTTTKTLYATAFDFVLDHEGRITENEPGDPGGKTKWGITHLDYDAYRHEHGLPLRDVFDAPEAEIQSIYSEHYWLPIRGDKLPPVLAFCLFDAAVNVGTTKAVRWLQTALGVTVDGNVGPNTLAAVSYYATKHPVADLVAAVMRQRRAYYNAIGAEGRTLHKFLRGWLNRCDDLDAALKAL